jgi:uncharacterized protein
MSGQALESYLPEASWFRHNPFGIHGVAHAARVLVWTDWLARAIGGPSALAIEELRWAAACHDVGRENDGVDAEHPIRSAEWVRQNLVRVRPEVGVAVDVDLVAELCRWHTERDRAIPALSLELLILKDADALDRARLGDLDERRLRLACSRDLVEPAEVLYNRTGEGSHVTGSMVLKAAASIEAG